MVKLVYVLISFAFVACQAAGTEFYRQDSDERLIDAIRKVVGKDASAGLITIDSDGQPRVRTVDVRPLGDDMSFWVATKPNTRKVLQIHANPKVTLYFSLDDEFSYVSVMGTAILHDDFDLKEAKKWRSEATRKAFWPNYPDEYLLIEIRPIWIEVLGNGIAPHPETWRPQGIFVNEKEDQ